MIIEKTGPLTNGPVSSTIKISILTKICEFGRKHKFAVWKIYFSHYPLHYGDIRWKITQIVMHIWQKAIFKHALVLYPDRN